MLQVDRLTTPVGVANPSMVRIRFSSHHPYSGVQSSNFRLMPRSWAQCCAILGLNCDCRPTAIEVRLPILQDGFSLLGFENDANRHRRNAHLLADPFGIRHLETEAARDLRCGRRTRNAAGGAVDHVDTAGLQFAGEDNGVIQIPAVLCAVNGGDADEQRHRFRHFAPHRLDNLERQAHAPRAVAAIFIIARVGNGGKKRREQIAMGCVDLDHVETGVDGISGRCCPGAHHRPAFIGGELVRGKPSRRDGLAGWADRLPQPGARLDLLRGQRAHAVHRALRGRLAPAMRELNADRRVLALHEGDEGLEALHLCVVPDAKIMLVDQADLFDGGCLDKDKPKAAQGIAAEMHVVKHAAGAARPGAVVDHRRHDQAVLKLRPRTLNGWNNNGRAGARLSGGQV